MPPATAPEQLTLDDGEPARAPRVELRRGDMLDVLPTLPAESVHAVVTDPPYGLADHKPPMITAALTAWLGGDRDHAPDGRGFMGKEWDGFVPPPAVWDECLRVLKPGGHLLCFAAPRTVDLMGLSIRLAGFELRDSITWLYSQGFPKSLDVSKAIDKVRDDRADILRVTTYLADHAEARGITRAQVDEHMGTSDMGGWWLSRLQHRCQVPRWEQWEQLRGLLGFGVEMDAEVWRLNGRKGTPGEAWQTAEVLRTEDRMNEASGVVSIGQGERTAVTREIKAANSPAAEQWSGWGTALKPAAEPLVVARKPLSGTVAANVLAHGTGALNVDGCRVETNDDLYRAVGGGGSFRFDGFDTLDALRAAAERGERTPYGRDARATLARALTRAERMPGHDDVPAGRWPANVIVSHAPDCAEQCRAGCPVAELDAQSGIRRPGERPARRDGIGYHDNDRNRSGTTGEREVLGSGGASRFFATFRHTAADHVVFPTFPVMKYQAKAPASERPKIDGKGWPTVKPLALMRWLVRLVTPPGGTVLDCFAGSGTTLQACVLEGFDSIGVERDPFAYALACQRLGLEVAG